MGQFAVEIEPGHKGRDGQPSVSPVYRNVWAKEGFPQPVPGLNTSWEIFSPLAHILDRAIEEFFFHRGASVGYWQGDPKLLAEDLMELKPTLFAGVPRVFDRIYAGGMRTLKESNMIKRLLFSILYNYKLAWIKLGFKQSKASPLADSILFSKIKARLGGRVRLILSGAAPLNSSVEEFLRVTTCAHVLQGYGLTETGGISSVCLPDEISMLGTVGPPSPTTEVCLESVPEMGYDALAVIPQGELCFRGKTMFSGYYKREDLTKEAFKDGWFHTGRCVGPQWRSYKFSLCSLSFSYIAQSLKSHADDVGGGLNSVIWYLVLALLKFMEKANRKPSHYATSLLAAA